ncbi:MAG: class I SAM-dependent methyltransferase [Candidatus Marinimicrobia bacterium]|nr:class I SAM-dependent methyltransferase [Candidatus Neomarinimicrobiota bacterium]MCF7903534.1 class I SAM-dependent methyltransferase [Candidatus Neomarinimicrobiota bacterium]
MKTALKTETRANNHFYDGWAYQRFIDPALASIRKRVAAIIPEGSTVLDVGGGTGNQVLFMAEKIKSAICIELSETMVNTARRQADRRGIDNCDFQLADATDLSHLADKSFDYSISSMVIHEMPEAKRLPVLKEMKRLGNQIILVDWIYPQTSTPKLISTHIVEFMAGWQHYAGFRSFMQGGGMPALLQEVGLEVIETQITNKGTIQLWVCHPA